MNFEWDPIKAQKNQTKHGVSFKEAAEVFADDYSSTVPDPNHSVGEDRYLIFGTDRMLRALVVAFTERNDTIRVISARQMTRRERIAYEQ